jgi:WbqC-like protein family
MNPAKKKVVAIHQPNFMPWCGYFHKILSSDIFIIMDNVQYVKGSWINRVQIKTQQGPFWVTIPVKLRGDHLKLINAIEICNDRRWSERILKTFEQNYRQCVHWKSHMSFLQATFTTPWNTLMDINLHFLRYIYDYLGLNTKLVLLSSLGVNGSKSELIAKACRAVGGEVYLSGTQAREYNDENIYQKYGVALVYQNFQHPVYPQAHGAFVPGLSVLDLLLNCGPESFKLLNGS